MFLQATLKGDVFQVFIATGSLGKTITNDVLLLILKANLKLKNMPLRRKKSVEYDLFRTVCFVHSHIKGCKSLINQLVRNHIIHSQNHWHFHIVVKADEEKKQKNPNVSIYGGEEEDKVVLCSPKDAVNFLNLKASISFSTFQYLTENKKGSSAERESLLWMWFIACWKSNLRYFRMTSRFNELEWSGRQRKVRSSHLWDRVDPRGPNSSSPQTSWGPDVAWNINSFSGYFDFPRLM